MSYDFSGFKGAITETKEWLSKEFSTIRTGRAAPALLDSVRVESYGSLMPLNQVANITIEDPRTIRVTPWDQSLVRAIDKAIVAADLGISAVTDDKGIRVIFPEVTGERRLMLIKVAKEKLEHARASIRQHRQDTIKDIQAKQKEGSISEDEATRLEGEVQKLVDEANAAFEAQYQKKEADIQV